MTLIMTCCFYSPLLPQAIPLALLSAFFGYWITKYHFVRRCKMPDMFSELMATFFSNLMPWLVLSWSLSTYIFLVRIRSEHQNDSDDNSTKGVISKETAGIGLGAVVVTIIYLMCPIRTCISNKSKKLEALDFSTTYESVALNFQTDYDKENPLTASKGNQRVLDIHIKKAEEEGKSDQVELLKKQQELMRNQQITYMQQMQQYN